MPFGTQRSWFVRPERRCKDVLGFQLESSRTIPVAILESAILELSVRRL
jgi:hypothetical protein